MQIKEKKNKIFYCWLQNFMIAKKRMFKKFGFNCDCYPLPLRYFMVSRGKICKHHPFPLTLTVQLNDFRSYCCFAKWTIIIFKLRRRKKVLQYFSSEISHSSENSTKQKVIEFQLILEAILLNVDFWKTFSWAVDRYLDSFQFWFHLKVRR